MIEIVKTAGAITLGELKSGLYVVAEKYTESLNLKTPFDNITIFLRSPHVHEEEKKVQCTIVAGIQENRVGLVCEMARSVRVFPVRVIRDMQVEIITTTKTE